jgi:putative beta-lysine N-acetyltransferase
MKADTIETIGRSRLQHGPLSCRVYLMHLAGNPEKAADAMERLASENGYDKLFAKVPGKRLRVFQDRGFAVEARIPKFFADGDETVFVARFLSEKRRRPRDEHRIQRVLETSHAKRGEGLRRPLPAGYRLERLGEAEAGAMAALYARVFETYPFPVFDPAYIGKTLAENFRYFGITRKGVLVAVASAEMDGDGAEMTDFATEGAYRSVGLAGHLLAALEADVRGRRIRTAFTIARSRSFGVNVLFSRAGYAFAGTLVNNTHISGRIESMNVWYKSLASEGG